MPFLPHGVARIVYVAKLANNPQNAKYKSLFTVRLLHV
jgi:hypothetical protein